jgi:DNA modification methylase
MIERIKRFDINKIYEGDVLQVLKTFPDESIDCCVTSPPYWGLRDYGTATWIGGDCNCDHKQYLGGHGDDSMKQVSSNGTQMYNYKDICKKCGAVRQDKQIGLEKTPEEYVQTMVVIFNEVKRVLKKEGTLWLNLGDSYCGSGSKGDLKDPEHPEGRNGLSVALNNRIEGMKPKDLVGIPWMTAFALRSAGWYLRQDIIWHKPNPMPESVTDRCTKSHEYIFLLSKSNKYYFDQILEPYTEPMNRWGGDELVANNESMWDEGTGQSTYRDRNMRPNPDGKNKRSVWTVNTRPYKEAHFATFPEELIIPMIKAGCPENGVVLDPFMGAGTTGLVCKKLNRNYVGIELNPKYIEIAEKRIADSDKEPDETPAEKVKKIQEKVLRDINLTINF